MRTRSSWHLAARHTNTHTKSPRSRCTAKSTDAFWHTHHQPNSWILVAPQFSSVRLLPQSFSSSSSGFSSPHEAAVLLPPPPPPRAASVADGEALVPTKAAAAMAAAARLSLRRRFLLAASLALVASEPNWEEKNLRSLMRETFMRRGFGVLKMLRFSWNWALLEAKEQRRDGL